MRVLVVNKFLHHVGGVETYVDWQARHLADAGLETHFFGMAPPEGSTVIQSIGDRATFTPTRDFNGPAWEAVKSGLQSIYSPLIEERLLETLSWYRPDVVHFHSTCRQLTPSVARALNKKRIPGVLTAHEYKQVCATQRLWDERRNTVCTSCLTGGPLSRMRNVATKRCVRGSLAASLLAVPEIPVADHLWSKSGVVLHAPSKFMGEILEGAPYISNRVRTLDLPWGGAERRNPAVGWERRLIYLGRLEREKGVDVLLRAWAHVERRLSDVTLTIAGDGSERVRLEAEAKALGLNGVIFTGRYERDRLNEMFDQVAASIHPSRWFENSPYTVRESLLHAVPAIVSDVGGMPEMVGPESGSIVPADDPLSLSDAIIRELANPRAGSSKLVAEVDGLAMGDSDHIAGLKELYDLASRRSTNDREMNI